MSARPAVLAALVALAAVPAVAESAPPAQPAESEPSDAKPSDAAPSDAEPSDPKRDEAEPSPAALQKRLDEKRRARMRCGCASPRLLRRSSEVTLGDGRALAAWLRGDGEASLRTFTQPEGGGPSTSVSAPLAQQAFVPDVRGEWVETPARLLRVYATGASEPFYLGVEVPPRKVPGDVVRVAVEGSPGAPASGTPPDLEELWVGALVDRQTPGCGRLVTRRLLTEAPDGAATPAAFLVEHTPAGGPTRATLVDERHARIFGLGRVDPCEHGLPLDEGPGTITVRAVGEDFGVGPAWTFSLPADPSALPTPLAVPDGRSLDVEDNPFLKVPRDPLEDLMDDDTDYAAVGLMAFVLVGAAALAQLVYRARRKRKPFVVETTCPSCAAALSLDLNDPDTDGMFCPKCGRSSVFVAREADGSPRAKVIQLEKDGRPPDETPPAA